MTFPSVFRVHRRELPAVRVAHPALPLVDEVNRLFDDFFRDYPAGESQPSFVPSLAVEETADAVTISAELPGLEEKDFSISVEEGVFTLRGEKRSESSTEKAGWKRSERSYGSFERRITLPAEVQVEKASAAFKNGVLDVTLPKQPEVKAKAHTIPIKAA
ncbi:MAG TPA: Hsp20/alpha crystallin family protein [Myxococcota bacterium]|jgi:HSP20 family protein